MLPPQAINKFLTAKSVPAGWTNIIPYFPVHDSTGIDASWEHKPYVVYDWISLRTPTDLYPRKTEQLVYSIRGQIDEIYKIRDDIVGYLDRQDESANELNLWQQEALPTEECVSFHTMRAWQSGRVVQPDQTKQFYTLPMIIEYILTKS